MTPYAKQVLPDTWLHEQVTNGVRFAGRLTKICLLLDVHKEQIRFHNLSAAPSVRNIQSTKNVIQ